MRHIGKLNDYWTMMKRLVLRWVWARVTDGVPIFPFGTTQVSECVPKCIETALVEE